MDITDVIASQHEQQRLLFAYLEQWPSEDTEGLGLLWRRLVILLEIHAEAEEHYFLPVVLRRGEGGADADSTEEAVEDAVGDHNKIRDAVREADRHEVGTEEWWEGVSAANVANSNHMAEEERQDLTDVRRRVGLEERHRMAVDFLRHEARYAARGVTAEDVDPERYVDEEGSTSH